MFEAVKKLRGAFAWVQLVRDPNQLEQVFRLSETLADQNNLAAIAQRFARSPEGREGLQRMPRLGPVNLHQLVRCDRGTVGRAFAEHMLERGLDPDAIPKLTAYTSHEWVLAHLYETHDLWHVLTGFHTDVAGELGLQAFYGAQLGSPLPFAILAAGLLNTAHSCQEDGHRRMDAIVRGWTEGCGARSLLGVQWGTMWHAPLREVRARYGLEHTS